MRAHFYSYLALLVFSVHGCSHLNKNRTPAQSTSDKIKAFESYAFPSLSPGEARHVEKLNTNAVLVLRGGRVIYEKYKAPFDATKRHPTWSIAKSYVNILIGVAVKEKRITLSSSLCEFFPSLKKLKSEHCEIQVGHLLHWSSGLDWNEVYEGSILNSSVLAMLYGRGHKDTAAFVAEQKRKFKPGSTWYYSSGDSVLLAGILAEAYRDESTQEKPWKRIAREIGANSFVFEVDAAGTPVGSSYLFSNARDLAKLGELILSGGYWQGKPIFDRGWIESSIEISEVYTRNAIVTDPQDIGAAQWWSNAGQKAWPLIPEDAVLSRGHWGQLLAIIPSEDLVIVRFGDDREEQFDINKFVGLLMEAVND